MSETWRPMWKSTEEHSTLAEGVPIWMEHSLWEWLRGPLFFYSGGRAHLHVDFVAAYERVTRSEDGVATLFGESGLPGLRELWDDDELLQFLDFCIVRADEEDRYDLNELQGILEQCGSAWKVGTRGDHPGLERRVPSGVEEAAVLAMDSPGHAGPRLSEAWHAVYGVNPSPSHAYAMAVKAVEDAAVPVVVPKQSGATLGHVIGQLRNDRDWSLPLTREDPAAPTAETVLRLCQGLWKGHHDRHGGDAAAPAAVGQHEAEAAVQIAVFLVHGFATGMIARRSR